MNDDSWHATCVSYRTGAREKALECAHEAFQETCVSNKFLRAIHKVNSHAVSSDRFSSSSQPSQSPYVPVPPDSAPLSVRLFVNRVNLIATYNLTLSTLNCQMHLPPIGSQSNPVRICNEACRSLQSTLLDTQLVLQALLHLLGQNPLNPTINVSDNENGICQLFSEGCESDAHLEGDKLWVRKISDAVQNILHHLSELIAKLSPDEVICLEGWARAAADTFDLAVAASVLTLSNGSKSTVAKMSAEFAGASQALRTLARSLRPAGDNDDITWDDADAADARTAWLQAICLSKAGDGEAALALVLPRARAALEARLGEHPNVVNGLHFTGEEIMYLAAVLLLQRGGPDIKEAAKFASGCAERMFRTADSLAIVARAEYSSSLSVDKWALALGVDGSPRPAGLWLTSRAFGRIGMPERQAEILELAVDALFEDGEEHNAVDQMEVTVNDGDPTGVIRLCNMPSVNSHGTKDVNDESIGVMQLKAERGRALCAAGKLDEGKKLFRECGIDLESETGAGVQLEMAWTLSDKSMNGEEAQRCLLEEESKKLMDWERMGLFLARAERMLRGGLISEARRAVEESMRAGLYNEGGSSGCEILLRGICYNNVGVVRVCDGDVAGADEWFAASQTALDKAIEEDVRLESVATELGTMATLGRCIAMAMCGRRFDAASHWVAKRGINGREGWRKKEESATHDDATSDGPIVNTVSNKVLLQMDNVCLCLSQCQI